MKLLLVRHGIAEDQEEFAKTKQDDTLRPLTKEGRWKMERVSKGLRRAVPAVDVLAASPLVRAAQTAKIIAARYGDLSVATTPSLEPNASFDSFLSWLKRQRGAQTVAAVGHEPHLGGLATWLLTGSEISKISFRKGGACLLEFESAPSAGGGVLLWALTPALLRALAN
jgi:phosphohistidine phosphatase